MSKPDSSNIITNDCWIMDETKSGPEKNGDQVDVE